MGSHIIHRAFTTHFALMFCLFAVCICLPFISAHQLPFSMCSSFSQSALTLHLPFKWDSRTFQGLYQVMDEKWYDEKYLHPCWLIYSNSRIVYIIMCMILYFRLIEDNLKRSLSLGRYLVSRQMRTMINRRFKTSLCKNQAEKLEMTTARYGRLWYKNDKNYLTHFKKIILCVTCV